MGVAFGGTVLARGRSKRRPYGNRSNYSRRFVVRGGSFGALRWNPIE